MAVADGGFQGLLLMVWDGDGIVSDGRLMFLSVFEGGCQWWSLTVLISGSC